MDLIRDIVLADPDSLECITSYIKWYDFVRRREKYGKYDPLFPGAKERADYRIAQARADYEAYRAKLDKKYGYLTVQTIIDPKTTASITQLLQDDMWLDTQHQIRIKWKCFECKFNGAQDQVDGKLSWDVWCTKFKDMPPMFKQECEKYEMSEEPDPEFI